VEYAFTHLDMGKVEMCVASDNNPSRAVCERLGMTLEGTITNAEFVQGRILDHAIYGLHREKT
jgi:ribosomal-protein-serine acetyltransferase